MRKPGVGEEVRYNARRGGHFLAHVVRVVDVVGGTLIITRNLAGREVAVDFADLYVDEFGRWVEGVRYR